MMDRKSISQMPEQKSRKKWHARQPNRKRRLKLISAFCAVAVFCTTFTTALPVSALDDISSDSPTKIAAASTSDFIELNLYDYGSNINTNYNTNNKYPGFQWNGGAFVKSSYDRHVIDYIDFGNSRITDFTFGSASSGTNGKSSNTQMIGKSDGSNGAINKLDVSSYGVTNRPIGMSLNSSITDTSADVLSRTLGSDGYPALTDGTSLSYLFSNGTYATKKNTTSIDGLFQQNETTGEYFYNSRLNHAQYSNNKFTLYNQIITPNFIAYPFGNFLPFNDITNKNEATQVGKITSIGSYVQGVINNMWYDSSLRNQSTGEWYDATAAQLVDMLAMYRNDLKSISTTGGTAWTTWSAKDAINDYFTTSDSGADNPSSDTGQINSALLNKMYNIDYDVETNFFFGMDMSMNFMQPKNGMTGNDTDGDGASDYPMKFYFTGDDDVWVYIDEVLFLDLSGIHRHVGGEIDFVNGVVNYYYLDTANTGDVSTMPYQTYTFKEILSAAGKSTDGLNESGTFKNYTTHEFKFYYMERGSGSSVCRLNFNFPLLKKNSITVTKENVLDENLEVFGNPDYYFNIVTGNQLLVGPDSKTGITSYKILDSGGNQIGTGQTDEYGIFSIKAGQTAVFEGISEDSGEFYVQELIREEDYSQYKETVTINGTTSRYNKLIAWDSRSWFANADGDNNTYTGPYGYKWYGYSSEDENADDDRVFYFEAQNGVTTDNLGALSITKNVSVYEDSTAKDSYRMYVTLDGEPLPVGTVYVVNIAGNSGSSEENSRNSESAEGENEEFVSSGTTKTVTEAGYIELASGQTASIENILSGTQFFVKEDEASADGYDVSYEATDADDVTKDGNSISGVVRTKTTVAVLVTNDEKGTSVIIPGIKNTENPTGESRVFEFLLQEVTDASGQTLMQNGVTREATVEVTDETPMDFIFTLNYTEQILEDRMITGLPQTFYYRITERGEEDLFVEYDTSVYVVEVTVSEERDNLQAAITRAWKDGKQIGMNDGLEVVFYNTLYSTYELPEAGGAGITPYIMGGTAIVLAAFLYLSRKRFRFLANKKMIEVEERRS